MPLVAPRAVINAKFHVVVFHALVGCGYGPSLVIAYLTVAVFDRHELF